MMGRGSGLHFGTLPTRVTSTSPSQAVVSITDDDVPSVTVSFEEASYTVAEGNSIAVKVKLSADPERTVTIPVTTANQGGATGADYSGVPGSVVFNSGDTEKTFSFSATLDTVDDDGESVKLGFGSSLPTGVTAGAPAETTVSITDDDVPSVTVSFEQASYTVAEGNNVSVKVVLSSDPERTVTIPLTNTNQGGASSADYSIPGSVVFNNGDTEKTFSFSATQDTVDDDGESVKLGFGNLPTGVSAGSTNESTVSITDDDVPSVTVSFEQGSYTVTEGSSVTLKVKLSADPERTVTIPLLKTEQGGASSADYSVPNSVVFNSGDTEKEFTFTAASDSDNDDGESVKLGFQNLPFGVAVGSTNETTVSITDDDVPSVTVSFEQASYTVAEGGSVSVKVKLSADPERTVTIPLTKTEQGGASSADYSVPGSVVFNNGDTEKEITFAATADDVDDDGESVKLGFGSSLPTGVTAGAPAETTVSITDDDVPSATVSFEEASYTVAEGNNVSVKVVLSSDPERTVTIPLTNTNQGGASSADYSIPGSVVFNNGDTEKTFSFSATQDTVDDDGESVKLGFGNLPTGVSAGSTNESTVSITDDDVPSVTVSFEQGSYTVTEGSSVTLKVKLSADPERTVTIPLLKTEQGGASSADYSVPNSVVFNSGDTEKEFTFTAASDSDNDDGESVKLGFQNLPFGVAVGSTNETTVSITDDDVPSVTVSFEQASYTVAEGDNVTVKVKLSADPERTVTIPLTKTEQGGASSADYSVPGSVVFNNGDTEKEITFAATADDVDDDGESVKLGFGSSLPTGVTAGAPSETTVSITDDDVPSVTVSFEEASYTVAEGASVMVKVKLSADPERTVTIPVTVTNQGGASASDYSVPGSVVFNSGDTEKTFDFEAIDDSLDDDGESVKLGFGNMPTGVTAGSTNESTVNITDDDVPSVTVSFEQASYTVAEGDNVTVKVKLSADPERTVTIPLTKTEQGGASSADYSVPGSVVFNSGEREKTFDFEAIDDSLDDDGETVKLSFGNLPTGVSAGGTNESTVSITDDDVPSVTVSFEQPSYTAAEGSSVAVKVKLSADPERTVTIPVTSTGQGGATSADYSVPSNVVFNSGDTENTFSFSATQDTVDDDGESVKLGFGSSLPTGVTAGAPAEATVSILDDDVPSVTVSFGSATHSVMEGESTTITVTLSADPERTVTIPITRTNQDDASDSDYSGVPSNVVFNSGDTEMKFDFEATDDEEDDNDESVKLTFGGLPTGVTEGTTNQTVVSIIDTDGGGPGDNKGVPEGDLTEVTVNFEQASYAVTEGDSVTVKVTLDQDPGRTVTIPLTKTEQGGASTADYSEVPASVEFVSGDTEKTFTFSATQDTANDDGESVKLAFGDMPDGVTEGTTNESTVSITDDDVPSVTVSYEEASYTVAEGDSVTVKVKLSADPERTITIPLSEIHQNGASSADYSGVPASVVFDSGDTEKTFRFDAIDDALDDDGESVKLGFGNLPAGVSAGATSESTVSIADDDVPAVTVSFEQASYTVGEGSSESIKVILSADPERTVEVPLSVTDMDGASSSDYSIVPQTVVFNSGDTEKTFSFSATQDTVDDDGESVRLTFGTLPARVTSAAPSQAVVSIADDDDPSVSVNFQMSTYSLTEGWTADIAVTLSGDPERNVSIPLTTTHGTGMASGDYSGVPFSVEFVSGQTQKSFTLTAEQDDIDEDSEELTLGYGTLPDGVSTGTIAQTVVTITDSIHVSFGASYYQAYEGGSGALVTVDLDNSPSLGTVIPITATGMNGATSADWTGVPDSLTFGAGESSKSFTVMAYDDTVEDSGETVQLGFGDLPRGVARGSRSTATVELMNMEVPQVNRYMCPPDAGERIILESVGEISQAGESDFWRVKLDLQRLYIIEVLGKDSGLDVMNRDTYTGDLTLEDPAIAAVWDDGRNVMRRNGAGGSDNGGTGRNSLSIVNGFTPSGWLQIEVQGKGGTGTYQIKVRVNNVCINVNGVEAYPYFGGPDGYMLDTAGDVTTEKNLMTTYSMNWRAIPGYLGDNWSWYRENEPDVDWIRVHLKADHEYTIEVWTEDHYAPEYQATDLMILGVYDSNGVQIPDTSSPYGDVKVTLTFEPDTDGVYYVAVGSGESDRTGTYSLSIAGVPGPNA